ncbi:4-hydroxythreonine-4-phosphate dehydrogenase PdxA [Chrysiogenes arsenatis]|uniref:4-hydroxythreonine-4-phosphate dehydrogenase PdxA n=1 Tax=Chrysiogenes arsenatis TaxID=309797 RepID=UPI0003F6A97F|nr:4-hydroxythreonine-4-phosphate dehydrogenase PdxA [Chrysiogenes arsenatis]
MHHTLPTIAFTLGDVNGIGPEIFLKAYPSICQHCQPIVIGDRAALEFYAARLNLPMVTCSIIEPSSPVTPQPGTLCAQAGKASAEFVITAIEQAMAHTIDAIVTLPLNKEALHLGGYHYAGHTEMLGEYTGSPTQSMMLVGGDVRVVLATTHIALADVAAAITPTTVERALVNAYAGMAEIGIRNPRIAVCALNPHGSDGGIFGNEEQHIIAPTVLAFDAAHGTNTIGPLPADSLFAHLAAEKCYDAVVCMYHDQGLIPVKMAAFGMGVNITLGLPIIRTSVDHGTAYPIAGKGIARYESLLQATEYAIRIIRYRRSVYVR